MYAGRLVLLTLAVAVLSLGLAGPMASASQSAPETQVLDSGPGSLELEIRVPQPRQANRASTKVSPEPLVLDGYLTGPDGLPTRDMLVGLPPNGEITLTVEPLAPTEELLGSPPAVPQPHIAEEHGNLALQASVEMASLPDEPLTLPTATLVDVGYVRDRRVGRVRIAPLAYLGNSRWQLIPHFRIRLAFDQPAISRQPAAPSEFDAVLEGSLVNGIEARGWTTANPPIRTASPTTLPANTWRIPITADGVYRISYQTLADNGVLDSSPSPSDIHLLWRGQPVALQEVGMDDSPTPSIDPGDYFVFYAEKFHGTVQEEKYTDENVYWLYVDNSASGLRMVSRSVAPDPTDPYPPAEWYLETVRTEENNYYWSRWSTNPGTDTTWFWGRRTASSDTTYDYPLELTDPAPGAYTGSLEVGLAYGNTGQNHTGFSINGTDVGEDSWSGRYGRVFSLPVDVGPTDVQFVDGANTLGVTLLTDVGSQDLYFDYAELTYRRLTTAENDKLAFAAPFDGSADYLLTGFTSDQIRLYDLASTLTPVVLTGAVVTPDAATWNLEFDDTLVTGNPYYAIADPAIPEVPALTPFQPTLELLSDTLGADEIIITPSAYYDAVLPLAAYRQATGLRVQIVLLEDVYALFNGGIIHPTAIRDFLAHAYQNWQAPAPAYALLVGDGDWNPKGHAPGTYGAPKAVQIPPYLAFVDPWQGEVPVDTMYARLVGNDDYPDIALGRLPAVSLQEVQDIVAKIIAYETGGSATWQDRLLFVADNVPDTAGDFEYYLDQLRTDYIPSGMVQDEVYVTATCGPPVCPPSCPHECPVAEQDVIDTWSLGVAMVTFMGHGSINRWTHEFVVENIDLVNLQPNHGLPFVISLNCLDGYWTMPTQYPGLTDPRSLAESMVVAADRGSIANFAPSGLGTVPSEDLIARNLYRAMFTDGKRRLGEISLAGQLTPISYPPHIAHVSTLFGDPAGWTMMSSNPTAVTLSTFSASSNLKNAALASIVVLCLAGAMVAGTWVYSRQRKL